MKICINKSFIKSKVLSLVILLFCYIIGYSLGNLRKFYSNKAIRQPLQFPSKVVALNNNNAAMQIRLLVKLGERQVYVYQGKKILNNFRIGVGKTDWETPVGSYKIIYMKKKPIFRNFKTGEVIHPGIENPLGERLIVFKKGDKFDFAIHGTNQDELIGQAVSHGCIRMRNQDVIRLYEMVNIGTPISIVP